MSFGAFADVRRRFTEFTVLHPIPEKLRVVVELLLVLGLHGLVRPALLKASTLSPAKYSAPSLVASMLASSSLMVPLLLGVLACLIFRRRLAWQALESTNFTRWLVLGTGLVLAVTAATLDYNAWWGRTWALDRVVLIALALSVIVHPGFSLPFLALLFIFYGQIAAPLPDADWHWPDKRLPADFLILFVAFLAVRLATGARLTVLVGATLILIGGAYSHAGICKLTIGPHPWTWPLENPTSNIFVSAYLTGGWLRPLGDERVIALSTLLGRLDPWLNLLTVTAELAGLFLLLSPRFARALLVIWIFLHAGILVTTGIFFWKWMLFDFGSALWLARLGRSAETGPKLAPVFAPVTAVFGVLAMLVTPRFYRNVDFAWFDTRLATWFELSGVGLSGQTYRIDPRFFAPYDTTFQQSRFHYLRPAPALVGTYGVAHSYPVFAALERSNAGDIAALEQRLGARHDNIEQSATWIHFVETWFFRSRERSGRTVVPRWLSPPFHFQTFAAPNTYADQEPLKELRVSYHAVFHERERLVPLRREHVLSVELR